MVDKSYFCVCGSNEEGSGRWLYTSQVIMASSEHPRTLSYAANTTAVSSKNVPILYGWHVARCAAHLAGCSSSCMCCMQFGLQAVGSRVFALQAFTDHHVTVSWGRLEAAHIMMVCLHALGRLCQVVSHLFCSCCTCTPFAPAAV